MIGAILLIIFLALVNQGLFNFFEKKHPFFSRKLMNRLYLYHLLIGVVYYTYAQFNPSDSIAYFNRPQAESLSWGDFFGTSTTFIDFISYPFINGLGFTYEMMMALYMWIGFLGFLFAYLFFRENIPVKIKVFKKIDFLILILFLPNMHYWTSSLGKGAPIFLGLMMFAYALKDPKNRFILMVLSSSLIYFIRPHMFLFVAVGTVLGYMSGQEKVSLGKKILIYVGLVGGLVVIQDQILAVAGLEDSENLAADFQDFSENRAAELGKSGSGVDMSSYSLPFKLFTFWFRPLFIDAPGIMGLIVSIENLIYLLLFGKILQKSFLKFIRRAPIAVKMSLVVFLSASFAMTFVMSNLGIIIRQKSMVMYFIFFVIYYFLAQKKYNKILKLRKLRSRRIKQMEVV
ncbi:hypothetical protein [Salinimicrobium oceani]|uniref:Uncharacterized protein n=1 Tax=Salinimicrobium oceani TaxID=2722702 RepID=A0ABX1CYT6_9FLAO|nr:hypothetical protein [Salinimicrobium oceani]NJW53433.1 hypothetical protein [Salinimicrobium oceani]